MAQIKEIQRNCYVIYVRGRGFLRNSTRCYTEDFRMARLFSGTAPAKNAGRYLGEEFTIVPVNATIDLADLFTGVLST